MKPYMDPMKFMKRLDSKKLPTHFHIGVEVGGGKVRAGGAEESQAAGTYNKTSRGRGRQPADPYPYLPTAGTV